MVVDYLEEKNMSETTEHKIPTQESEATEKKAKENEPQARYEVRIVRNRDGIERLGGWFDTPEDAWKYSLSVEKGTFTRTIDHGEGEYKRPDNPRW